MGWGDWGNWGEWSDVCDDYDFTPNPKCGYVSVKATLYAATQRIKVHYYATCCMEPTDCGGPVYRCRLVTKICTTEIINGGYCSDEKEHDFGYGVGVIEGDDWFDIKPDYERYEHEAFADLYCNCAAYSGEAHASCRVQEGT